MSCVDKGSLQIAVFSFFHVHGPTLVAEADKYCNQYLDTLDNDDDTSWLLVVTVPHMFLFLVSVTQWNMTSRTH
jgi:hypothetical protein